MRQTVVNCGRALVLCSALLAVTSTANASSIGIISSLSELTFSIDIGFYEEEGNPDSFLPVFSAVGQGGVPVGPGKLPGSVFPGYSNGLSSQASGWIDFTVGPGTISIDSAAVTLLDSGLWQPGTDTNPPNFVFNNVAIPADLGAFIEGYLFTAPEDGGPPDVNATALIDALQFSLATGTVPLVLGSFSDPAGSITLTGADIAVQSNLGNFGSSVTTPVSQVVGLSGTFKSGGFTLPISGFFDQQIPTDLLTLTARIGVSGQLVTVIPEPASVVLMAIGGLGILAEARRRKRAN